MFKVYYAHHMWKYGTKIEAWELELIRQRFPDAKIINPATDIDQAQDEGACMAQCLSIVRNEADALVFSHLSGVVGMGVMKELEEAQAVHLPIFGIMGACVQQLDASNLLFRGLTDTGHRSVYAELCYGDTRPR